MDAVKLEGGKRMVKQVRAIVESNINVMGHVGLLPQTAASFGGYRVQGKSAAAARELVEDALALQERVFFCCWSMVYCTFPALIKSITGGLRSKQEW